MKRNILRFGLISGAIVSAIMATSMAIMGCSASSNTNMTMSMVVGFASMVAAFSFIFVGIKNYRDKQNEGVITFGNAFLMGLMISLIASTMYVVTWGIEYHVFFPNMMDKYFAMQVQEINNSGMSADQMQKAIEEAQQMKYNYNNNIFYFAMYTYAEIFPVGVIVTLISSLILKRKVAKG